MRDLIQLLDPELWVAIIGVSGTIIGYFIGYIVARKKRKDIFSVALFQEYRDVADELENILKDLLSLSFIPKYYPASQLKDIADKLSAFYFKNYMILPQPVLEEIQCLYTCLHHNGKRMYVVGRDEYGNKVQKEIRKPQQFEYLLKDTSIMMRTSERAIRILYKDHPEKLKGSYLNFQARHVNTVMHDCWNAKKIFNWHNNLSKDTIAKKERKTMLRRIFKMAYWKQILKVS
jgi:hypothetical protein